LLRSEARQVRRGHQPRSGLRRRRPNRLVIDRNPHASELPENPLVLKYG
jgi:hypothetical protein